MTRLNSRKVAAIAATFITTGFVLGCVGVQSTAARNAPTPGVVNTVQTSPGTTTPTTTPVSLSFLDVVPIQQEVTHFLDGDRITITEVYGTAEAITAGNIYCIKGTYALTSHRQAMLAAFVTAMDPAEGKVGYLKVQKIMVNQGAGNFVLFLPMTINGSPHVSFYPAGGGESFGGAYFGTGSSVLKQWWDSGHTDIVSTLTKSPGSTPASFTFTESTPPRDKSDNPGIGQLPWGVR